MPLYSLIKEEPTSNSSHRELEQLFRQHHRQVFRAAYRITGSAQDAEDVLQTVFLRLLKRQEAWHLATGDAEQSRSVARYLQRSAVNAAIDVLRARKRSDQVPLGELEGSLQDPGLEPDKKQRQRELRRGLRQALLKLSPQAAEIFILRYFEGYGNGKIAEILGSSRASVAVTLHRSRRRLKKELRPILGGV